MAPLAIRSKAYWVAAIKSLRNEIVWFLPLCLVEVKSIDVNLEVITFPDRDVSYFCILREAK